MAKTFGEQMAEALACQDQHEANLWLLKKIGELCQETGKTPDQARELILSNLGYMAGYYGQEEAEKLYRLFGATHPIFGPPAEMAKVTPEQAFRMGQEFAKKGKRGA